VDRGELPQAKIYGAQDAAASAATNTLAKSSSSDQSSDGTAAAAAKRHRPRKTFCEVETISDLDNSVRGEEDAGSSAAAAAAVRVDQTNNNNDNKNNSDEEEEDDLNNDAIDSTVHGNSIGAAATSSAGSAGTGDGGAQIPVPRIAVVLIVDHFCVTVGGDSGSLLGGGGTRVTVKGTNVEAVLNVATPAEVLFTSSLRKKCLSSSEPSSVLLRYSDQEEENGEKEGGGSTNNDTKDVEALTGARGFLKLTLPKFDFLKFE
jgi:hypothetical protein